MVTVDLSLSELRYRRLFEAAHDGILIVDPETRRIVDVNPFLVGFLGYAYDEFIGKELFEFGLFGDEEASQAAFRELQSKGYIRYDDLPLKTRDGQRVDVEFVSNLYDEGDAKVIQCNIRDISGRKAADAALRESEERFKLVARAVSDVVWDWNLVTDRVWWSDGFLTTFGYRAPEIEPGIESWEKRIHPDERNRVMKGVHRAIDSGENSWSAEYAFRCRNGSYAVVQHSGYILRTATGQGVRMVGGLRDLTKQRAMQAQHLRAERMESIGTLAGGIAHDLNNVLTPIMMSIELLKLDSSNDPERNVILDTIHVSCRRGADLVAQVLSFARGLDGNRVAVHLRNIIDEQTGVITRTFPRNITIMSQVPDDLWPINGDPSQLHQVLLNLAINARDAMPDGGTLTLSAKNILPRTGNAPESLSDRHVLLEVSDTGAGIPAEIRERIFEPFFTTKALGKGTGFGLATVNSIVKNHGGLVNVETQLGRGTTFQIYLPVSSAPAASSPPPARAELPRGRDELVLVVDDEPSILDIARRTLEAFGYRVLTAQSGADALALYATQVQEIAVVLTDMKMPVMDGATLIGELRRINPAVRVIVVSGLEVSESMRADVQGVLAKPFSAQTLAQKVREVLDGAAQRPPLHGASRPAARRADMSETHEEHLRDPGVAAEASDPVPTRCDS